MSAALDTDEPATSTIADVVDLQQPDLDWRRVGQQDAADILRGMRLWHDSELQDGRRNFEWLLRQIVHVRALYTKVQLPKSHADHIASSEWCDLVKQITWIRHTQAQAIVQRKLADRLRLTDILDRVGTMESIAAERHRPLEYPRLGKLLSWFPDPRNPPRPRRPPRVDAQDAHIAELESQIELLHADAGDHVRQEQLLVMVILAQQIEIERLRGTKVVDDRPRPTRGGPPKEVLDSAWDAELRRSGRMPDD